jgi:hypothetical protein
MAAVLLVLALAGFAAASPAGVRGPAAYPPVSVSKTFTLVLNATDPARDTIADTNIQGLRLTGIHAGAGINAPTVTNETGIVFYTNTTESEKTGIEFDFGFSFPLGFRFFPDTDPAKLLVGIGLNIGYGTDGLGILADPRPCPAVFTPEHGTFILCDRGFSAPSHPRLLLQFVKGSDEKWYESENVPAECIPVKLVPQCAAVPELPDGFEFNDTRVIESRCYKDVASIQWSQYSQCW